MKLSWFVLERESHEEEPHSIARSTDAIARDFRNSEGDMIFAQEYAAGNWRYLVQGFSAIDAADRWRKANES
jgi:hypothetical protein